MRTAYWEIPRWCLTAFAIGSLIFLGALAGGCGSSPERQDTAEAGNSKDAQALHQIRREMEELRRRYPASQCGEGLLVNSKAPCAFAKNVENVYFAEAGLGSGAIFPYNPRIERDQKMLCTTDRPHKCTGGKVVVYFP